MNENPNQGRNFEERLLRELKAVVAQRGAEQEAATGPQARPPGWRRPSRLAFGAILATALAVLVFSSTDNDTPNAFAKAFTVERQGGGGVTIKIFSAEDAAGLQRALARAGIRSQVTWLPAGMRCREPRFRPSTAKTSLGRAIGAVKIRGPGEGVTIGVMTPQQWRERGRGHTRAELAELTPIISLDPESFRPDQTVVISGSPVPYRGDPKGGYTAHFGVAEGPVEPCEPLITTDDRHPSTSRVLESEPGKGHPEASKGASSPSPASEQQTTSAGGGQSPATPAERQGGSEVAIRKVSVEDGARLERGMARDGIRSQVSWLAAGMTCREPRFTPSGAKTSEGGTISGGLTMSGPGEATTIGVMTPQQWRERGRGHSRAEVSELTPSISLDPESLRPDQTVVIFGSRGPYYGRGPEGGFESHIAIAEGPVKQCEPIVVPHGGALGGMNRILESEAHSSSNVASNPSSSSEAPTTSAGAGQHQSK